MICPRCKQDMEPEWEASVLQAEHTHVRVYVEGRCPDCDGELLAGVGNVPLQRPGQGMKPPRRVQRVKES